MMIASSTSPFTDVFAKRIRKIDVWLSEAIESGNAPERLKAAMLYSLQAGGKRIRPVLCLSCAALFGMEENDALPFAGAIEMIHTYSLIHDDLPAMDDDDLRRGRPSNHIAFDEATAILAGDGLLADAFFFACRSACPVPRLLEALKELAYAVGSSGMTGGQALDMAYTAREDLTLADIERMQFMKTGMLLAASCTCGALLAGADEEDARAVSRYGKKLGAAFQIKDDLLDIESDTQILGKPAGSDLNKNKSTFPALAGLETSKIKIRTLIEDAKNAISNFTSPETAFLKFLADSIALRNA